MNSCPFCGSDRIRVDELRLEAHAQNWAILCDDCEAQGPIKRTLMEAVQAWDAARRATNE